MNLDFFMNLEKNDKSKEENLNFIEDLEKAMDEKNIGILEKIQSKNKVSISVKNKLDSQMEEILIQYAKETREKGDLYFVVEKSHKDNTYTAYQYTNDDDDVIKLLENEIPICGGVNSVLRLENGNYILDEEGTKSVSERIEQMAKKLIDEQNETLENYRKDGHKYRVTEKINDNVFLVDITDNSEKEIEEVEFPERLLDKAIEGTVFEYFNGEYHMFTN